MPINPNIPLEAGRGITPMNVGGAMNAGLSLANNALTNQRLRAERSAGQDWQHSIQNGTFNPQAYQQTLANDPNAAFAAPQYSQQALTAMHQELANRGISLDQAHQRATYVGDLLGGHLAQLDKGQSLNMKNINQMALDAMHMGFANPKETASFIKSFVGLTPKEITAKARDLYAMAQHTANAVGQQIGAVSNGAGTILYNTNPAASGGVGNQLGYVGNKLSPGEASSPITFTGPGGQPITETRAQIAANNNRLVMPGPGNKAVSGRNPLAPKSQTPTSGVVAGLTPGEQAAQTQTGAAQGNLVNSIFGNIQNIAQSRAALTGILAELNQTRTGPLSQYVEHITGALNQIGLKNFNEATALQLLHKGQAQLVVSQVANGLGVPTDQKMAQIAAQTPGNSMTKQAAKGAAAMIAGLLDYKEAEARAAQTAGVAQNPTQAFTFTQQWQRRFPNAAVFQFHHLPMALKREYWQSMSKSAREKFYNQYTRAAQGGFVPENPFGD